MSTFSFVFFDLDDTLLDHRSAERSALRDVHARYGDDFSAVELERFQEAYHTVNSGVWHRYGSGLIDKQRAKLERFELLLTELSVAANLSPEALSTYYMHRYSHYWAYVPKARESFQKIAATYPVGILTNGFVEVQRAKLGQFEEVRSRASVIVISEEVGYMKPDVRIFNHAAAEAGFPAEQILYIGDSYRSDVLGGQQAGWQVCWFQREATSPHRALPATETETANAVEVSPMNGWDEIVGWMGLSL